jgi:hypothetical protein
MPRGRFNYSRFGGFSGYGGDMGDPASSVGGQALTRMTRQSAPRTPAPDSLWSDIESTFQDILGEYANMDLDMPIKPPDMKDPQDQMRYLKDLEALGMSSAPSAALMGSNIRAAMELITAQGEQQKQAIDMLMKVAPLVQDNPEMSAFLGVNILNTMFPGQFDIQDKSALGGWAGETPGVGRLTPENATEGELFKGISTMATPQATEFYNAGDKEGLKNYLDLILKQLVAGKMDEAVAITIVNQIHADAIGASKAREPVY